MGKVWNLQSNMNRGELDPLLVGRKDLAAYYNGVESGTNTLVMPQGGLTKRPGTQYLGTALDNGRFEKFSFNTEQEYLLVFTNLKMQIYKDGVLQTNINGTGNPWLVTPWTLAQVLDFDFIQSADTIIITHPNVRTRTITRTSHTTWVLANAPFTNIPQYDFNDGSSPAPTTETQLLGFVNHVEGDRFKISLEGILTDELVWANNDAANIDNIEKALLALPNTPNAGITAAIGVSLASYFISFANEAAKPWELLTVTPIWTKNATFQASSSRTATGVARTENVWSATRGWPSTCSFHEGRLWFGGSDQRPSTLWGSRPFDFYNFDQGKGLPDDAVESTLDTDQVNAIQAIFSNVALQVFTTGQEFYVPESPITPENVALKPQSNMGSKRVRPVTIDGSTFFVQKTGKALLKFLYLNDLQAHQTSSISLLASHLIVSPIKLAVSRGTEETDANYIYIVNNDGSMSVFNFLESEGIASFTPWQTSGASAANGLIKSCAVVDNKVNVLVERTVGGGTVYHIEQEETGLCTDCSSIDSSNDAEITGLNHLEGETVWAKADGAYMGEFTVSSGKITLNRTSADKEAGLSWVPTIKTMPLNINLKNGPNASVKKRIAKASLQLHNSNGVLVNGERIADKTIGVNQFSAPIPQTGIVRISLLGWSLEAQLTITQNTPMPLTILNIGMEVAI